MGASSHVKEDGALLLRRRLVQMKVISHASAPVGASTGPAAHATRILYTVS